MVRVVSWVFKIDYIQRNIWGDTFKQKPKKKKKLLNVFRQQYAWSSCLIVEEIPKNKNTFIEDLHALG